MKTITTPVAGLFDSQRQAEAALQELDNRGIDSDRINVLDRSRLREEAAPSASGTVGAALSGAPHLNETIQPNPIALGGLTAGVAGQTVDLERELSRLGIDDAAAQYYANGIRNGGTVIVVDVKGDDARTASDALAAAGAANRN